MSLQLENKPICPVCKKILDGVSLLNNPDEPVMPKKDDISICVYCFNFLIFDSKNNYHLATSEEIMKWPDDVRINLVRIRDGLELFMKTNRKLD